MTLKECNPDLLFDPRNVSFATVSAAAIRTASAEWTYLLVIERVLWPSSAAIVGSGRQQDSQTNGAADAVDVTR